MVHFSKTTDLNIASYLVAKGYDLKTIEKLNDKQSQFVFVEDIGKDIMDSYYDNDTIGVLDFTRANKELKIRLHNNVS